MRKITENDPEAFERLYDKYGSILEQILDRYHHHHMSSEDFIQEVFTRLWQQRMNFRGQSRFLTYLYGIAKHTVNEEVRRSHKIVKRDLKARMDINQNTCKGLSEPETALFLEELTIALEKVRASLTIKERQAMDVSQDNDVPLRKVSRTVGCSHEALRSRLKRARKRLQELLRPILEKE
ncbi:MAG: sigma-70 family RNA polymerase sigma factor [bacterium]|nr:MAG: sigma-70 family RNA polymerase sigma factor [bacterium]